MRVVKRSGKTEDVKFDKISQRIKAQSKGLNVDYANLAQKAITGLFDGITSTQIDNFLAETAAVMSADHPHYGKLAARLCISSLHKETDSNFYQTTKNLYKAGIIADDYLETVKEFSKEIEAYIDYERDFSLDYFGFKTLEKSYLLKIDRKIAERPQHLFMRVAIGICGNDIDAAFTLYDLMSNHIYTHATPTLFNSGTKKAQMSSCFLVGMESDSIDGIFNTLKDCAMISKHAGGIGLEISSIRAKDSAIIGTNGISNGIVPMLKVFNETARYVDQGGGKRKGSFAIYLEPWHSDIESFLELKKPTGKEELRARDLFLAIWMPDLFMKRVKNDESWTLMCPNNQPGLADVYGDDFEALYTKYEVEFPNLKKVRARDLMIKIIDSMIETGTPYISFKDHVNKKSNQKNLGTIKSSNLCNEINQYSDKDETAVCNLASICLPKFVNKETKTFDFDKLMEVSKIAIKNLNRVIDKNFYPTPKTSLSNFRHRPTGLGVQGLADVFFMLELPFESPEALELDKKIFASMYYAAVESSCEIAEQEGPYETFNGSPMSNGQFQFDLWGAEGHPDFDWNALREKVLKHGQRNSLLIALMPTASTSNIFGNTEAFEVITSNIYKRQTLAGEFLVVNKYLIEELEKLGLWNPDMKDLIIRGNGSIQNISSIPESVKQIYKTVWEVPQKNVIDHSATRGAYVCQSQSMNLFFSKPTFGAINSALFYGWEKGLKTGSYYIRTKPSTDSIKVNTKIEVNKEEVLEGLACSIDDPENCEVCSS